MKNDTFLLAIMEYVAPWVVKAPFSEISGVINNDTEESVVTIDWTKLSFVGPASIEIYPPLRFRQLNQIRWISIKKN